MRQISARRWNTKIPVRGRMPRQRGSPLARLDSRARQGCVPRRERQIPPEVLAQLTASTQPHGDSTCDWGNRAPLFW
jgi:hypothetical protein